MNDANIKNDCHTRRMTVPLYETLTKREQTKLEKLTKGRGNLKAVREAIDIAERTLTSAMAGLKILPETASKIRNYISSN